MGKPIFDYDDGDFIFNTSSNIASNSYIAVVSLNLYGGCACRL